MRYIGYINIKSVLEVGIEANSKEEAKKALELYFSGHDWDEYDAEINSAEVDSVIYPPEDVSEHDWKYTDDKINASDYLEEEEEETNE